jgi:hypothetical protein
VYVLVVVVGRGLAEQEAEVLEVVEEAVVEAWWEVEVEAEDPGWAVVVAYELVF